MERLDKTLSKQLNIARSEAKALIKKGSVTVNGALAVSGDMKCADSDVISVDGKKITVNKYVYIMLNKPKGYISATEDKNEKTVLELVPKDMQRKGLFPAGRLDRDTTGFVLITDDGDFAHSILSPKKHVDKTYIATLDKPFTEEVKCDFESGMELGGKKLQKAELDAVDGDFKTARVVLREGMYHQVKRMFKKHGITVVELKRTKIGSLELDKTLAEGESRYIAETELQNIRNS